MPYHVDMATEEQLDTVIAYLCEVARQELFVLWGSAIAAGQTLPSAIEAFRQVEVDQR